MRPEWLWDRNISVKEIQNVLKDPEHERFSELAALLLSRNNAPKEIFGQYLDKKIFVQNWARIKRRMRTNAWNDPRIIFWQAVYQKLALEFKREGIPIRPSKQEKIKDNLIQQVAQMVRTRRQAMDLTQSELAEKIGISQQIISRIEKGRDNMRLLTLEKVFRFLGEQVLFYSRSVWDPNKISDGKREVSYA